MPAIDLSILNQRQTPAFYADVFANRPAAGFVGRIFVSTNTFAFYRDNGTSWDLIGGPGTGTITGSGSFGSIALWNGTDTITYDVGLTWDGTANSLTASKFIVTGGTSSQFLKGDGSLDSNTYNTGSGAVGQVTFWNGTNAITGGNDLFWDSANGHLGVNTNVPGTALDVHHDQPTVAILNQTVATNDVRIGFQNNGVGLWRIGAFYNAGANDFGIYDAVAAIQPVTVKKTTGQVLIGTSTVGSGKLVVASATGDNGIQIVGATAPSLRIDSAESGPTKRAGLGISTAVNNFIQGSADRDFCIFNGSTAAASPILFGIYSTGLGNVQEAARISPARNFIVGSTADAGQRLQITGTSYFNGNVGLSATTATNKLTVNNVAGGFTTVASISESSTGNSRTALLLQNSSATESNATGINLDFAGAVNWLGRINTQFIGGTGTGNTDMSFFTASLGSLNERMRLNSAGNLGLNVTPSAWTVFNAFQIGSRSSLASEGTVTDLNLNVYYDGSYKYIANATAMQYRQQGGAHIWYTAPIGTAGNTITFNEIMRTSTSSNLLVGTGIDAGQKLQVNGSALFTGILNLRTGGSGNNGEIILGANSANRGRIYYDGDTNGQFILQNSYDSTNTNSGFLFQTRTAGTAVNALKISGSGIINLGNVPTSSAGLSSGDIWSNLGVLTIVP